MRDNKQPRKTRQPATRQALVFEELEPRLLLSADLPVDVPVAYAPDGPVDEQLLQDINALQTETAAQETASRELVFVDTDTPDYQLLLDDLLNRSDSRQFEVILLDDSSDGIAQISEALSQYTELDAVHIISHGSEGSIDLGGSRLEFDSLLANASVINGWSNAFAEHGDLLIYGCNLATNDTGQALVDSLARLTGADVAASDDLTGTAEPGGDWELEYQTGRIETSVAVSTELRRDWTGTLAAPVANDNAYTVNEGSTLTVDWWNGAWSNRQQLSFDNVGQAENLTDFPVLIVLNAGNVDYAKTQNNGADLRFIDANGTELAYEIEEWNESGESSVWVRVPQITSNSNSDSILMYYGNAAAGPSANSGGVWDSNFVGVWHLNEEQAGTGGVGVYNDSTSFGNAGIDRVAASGQEGQVTDGQQFGANDWIEIDHDASIDLTDSMTISFWVKPTSDSGTFNRVVEKGLWGYNDSYYFGGGDGTNDLTFYLNGQEVIDTPDDILTVGDWQHAAVSYNSNGDGTGTAKLYLNGVEIATGNYTNGVVLGNTGRLAIGHDDPLYDFDGFIDEVQISNTDRSADWIAAQHKAMTDAFVSFGGAETAPTYSNVLANDTDSDGDSLSAVLVNGPSNAASFTLNQDGSFTYTPNGGFTGIDSFTYKANDGTSDSNTATVTITVNNVPAITSNGGGATANINVAENTTAVTTVTATDADLDTLTYSISGGADAALFSIDANSGVLTFNSAPNFEAPADANADNVYEVTVKADDGNGGFDTQQISVTVTDANETPLIWNYQKTIDLSAGTPSDDYLVKIELSSANLDYARVQADGDDIRFADTAGNELGFWMETWNPTGTSVAWVSVPVTGTTQIQMLYGSSGASSASNPAVVLTQAGYDNFNEGTAGNTPTNWTLVGGASAEYAEDSGDVVLTDTTAGGAPVIFDGPALADVVVTQQFQSVNGVLDHPGLIVRYADNNNYVYGGVTELSDNGTDYAAAIWQKVGGTWTSIGIGYDGLENDGQPAWIIPDVSSGWHTQELRVTGDTVTLYIDGNLIGSATLSGVPASGQTGFFAQYGGNEALRDEHLVQTYPTQPVITTAVNSENDHHSFSVAENTAFGTVVGNVLASDPDPADSLSYTITGGNTGTAFAIDDSGQITVNNSAALDFETNPNFTLTVTVDDGNGETDSSTVIITLTDVNDTPVTTADGFTVNEGSATNLNLAVNDIDADDGLDLTSITIVSGPTNGSIVVNTDGTVDYTHDGSETVADSFTYTIDDLAGATSNTVTVSLTITPVNDAPSGSVTISGTPTEDQVLTTANTLADEDGLGTISYQWQRDGVDISGATSSTYTLTQADVGTTITVVASYTDGQGTNESVTSAGVGPVANLNDAPTGSVTISGTSTEDQTLTASNTLADADGIGAISYQWQRDGVDIAGATASTYTLGDADVGATITVVASYTDGEGTNESVSSAGVGPVANINDAPTGSVAIDNTTPNESDILTASNTLADADGLGAVSYQWQRDGVDIVGATGTNYTTVQADVGAVITVVASYTDGHGTAESVTSAGTAAVGNINNAPTGSVTITGTPTEDQTLTASNTLADADGMGVVSYQWQRDGVDIAGATANTYTLGDADVGATVTVVASYTDGGGTNESVASAGVGPIANLNDAPTGSVTISGTPTEDQVLTAANTLADEDGLGTISYQWQRNGVDIGGATSSTYTLSQVDVGTTITVVASYTDGEGTNESVTSAGVGPIANVNDAPTGSLTISGTLTEDQTLTAANSLADEDGLGAISYQWQRNGADIAGATNTTYTLTQADVGTTITVVASYTDGQGTNESVTSAGVGPIANSNNAPTGAVTISGSPTEDQTLTVSNTLADIDGMGVVSYQWQRDGIDIAGATGSTYILGDADVGSTITVVASYTDGLGASESMSSAGVGSIANVNDAPIARPDGVYGSFDGDDFIQVANHASLQMTNNVTMEAWINHDGTGTGSQLIVNKEGEYELGITADTGEIKWAIANTGPTWNWYNTGHFVTAGEWTHVVVTYDGVAGEVRTYINGELVDTAVRSGAIGDVYPTYNDLFVGGRENAVTQRFQGQINEVRVWNSTRTQAEIQTTMDGLLTGGEPGLAGYWRLAEASGGVAIDQSPFGNDGTLGGLEGAAATPTYQGYFTNEDSVLTVPAVSGVLANDFDIDGDTLTVTNLDTTGMLGSLVLNPADGSFTYDPRGVFDSLPVGEHVTETFTYTANDGSSDSNTVTVTITVTGANDAPVGLPVITGLAQEDQTLTADTSGITDADGLGAFSYRWYRDGVSIGGATANTYTLGDADVGAVITVAANYTDDGGIAESVSSVGVGPVANVNDAPVANSDTVTTAEDVALNSIDVMGNDTDVDGDLLSVTGASAANGTVTVNPDATLNYIPNANFNGTDTITYDISDGNGGTATGTLTITVTAVNDNPVANADIVTTAEDVALNNIDVLGNDTDVDGDALSVTGASATNGTVTVNPDGTLNYTPNANFNGTDTISYDLSDGQGTNSNAGTVNMTVAPVNDAPISGMPSGQTTSVNTPLVFSNLDGNSISVADPDGTGSTLEVTLTASNGVLSLSNTAGLVFSTGSGTNDATMTFTGDVATINVALDGLSFQPNVDFQGFATLQLVTDDMGNSGAGGALNAVDSISISVVASASIPADLPPPLDELIVDSPDLPSINPNPAPQTRTAAPTVLQQSNSTTEPGYVDFTGASGAITGSTLKNLPASGELRVFETIASAANNGQQNQTNERAITTRVWNAITDPLVSLQTLSTLPPGSPIWNFIDVMTDQITTDGSVTTDSNVYVIGTTATGVTFAFSAGYVSWLLRAGYLSAALLSSAPVWRQFDPLPILSNSDETQPTSGKDNQDSARTDDRSVENIFELDARNGPNGAV